MAVYQFPICFVDMRLIGMGSWLDICEVWEQSFKQESFCQKLFGFGLIQRILAS